MNNEKKLLDPDYIKALSDQNMRMAIDYAEGLNMRVECQQAIDLLSDIEEDGRNVNLEQIKSLKLAIKALEFIKDSFSKTFLDYLMTGEVT